MLATLRYSISFIAVVLLVLCGVLAGLSGWDGEAFSPPFRNLSEPLSFSLVPFGSAPAPALWSPWRYEWEPGTTDRLTFTSEPLWDVFSLIRSCGGGIPIDVNWPALAAEGIRSDRPFSGDLSALSWQAALARVLEQEHLAATLDDNTIYVSTPREIWRVDRLRRTALQWPTQPERPSLAESNQALDESLGEWNRLPEVLVRVARRNRLDVDWASLAQAGVGPTTPIRVVGDPSDLLGSALRQASRDHDLQYEVRNGRMLVSTREWFDRDERPRRIILIACAIGVALITLVPFVLLRRRPGLRRIVLISLAALVPTAAYALTWATGVSVLEATSAGRRFTARATDGGRRGAILSFQVEPRDWNTIALNVTAASVPRIKVIERLRLSINRSPSPFVEFELTAPRRTIIGLLGIGPAFWAVVLAGFQTVRFLRRRARRIRGQCVACGYDLRASGERCPECGQAV